MFHTVIVLTARGQKVSSTEDFNRAGSSMSTCSYANVNRVHPCPLVHRAVGLFSSSTIATTRQVACSRTHNTRPSGVVDVDKAHRWGEYGSVSEGDSVTVDAAGSNHTIVVVHAGPYDEEEVYLRAEE